MLLLPNRLLEDAFADFADFADKKRVKTIADKSPYQRNYRWPRTVLRPPSSTVVSEGFLGVNIDADFSENVPMVRPSETRTLAP